MSPPLPDIEVKPGAFPGILADLARECGTPAAFALAELAGGTRLYIPEKLRPNHRLVQALGRRAAEWLVEHRGREVIQVPMARTVRNSLRAHALHAKGLPVTRIARTLGIDESSARRFLKGLPKEAAAGAALSAAPRPCPYCGASRRRAAPADGDARQLALPLKLPS